MVGTIKVVNIKNFDFSVDGEVVNIMRPHILGNPFRMSSEDEREIVVRKFYHYLRDEYVKKGDVYNELVRLSSIVKDGKDLYLVCCCYPKLCHGEVISRAIMGMISNEQKSK